MYNAKIKNNNKQIYQMCVIINRINIMNMENPPMTKMTDLDFDQYHSNYYAMISTRAILIRCSGESGS